jgi:Na+/melibiose symporter-like transporter
MIGLFMGFSGYEGSAAVQTASANTMIVVLYSVVPALFCLIQFILLKAYDLDKLLPQIRVDLDEKRKKTQE